MAENAIQIPEIKEILTTGLQFGHSTSRWNPRMAKYIFGQKNGIHIIDIVQSRELLEKAAEFLKDSASRGEIVFVGTKRQAADIVRGEAIRAGAHFVTGRWAGGIFTNFDMVQRSLKRLNELEKMFEEGVEGRTKYEISRMKVEWERLNRIYGGLKGMEKLPAAVVVIDPHFDKVAVRESRKMHIPVVALADTNCDPRVIDYIIPGNDDALGSIEFVMKSLADAILAGNEGKGVQHSIKDYSESEVKIIKPAGTVEEEGVVATVTGEDLKSETTQQAKQRDTRRVVKPGSQSKGILETSKERAQATSDAKVTKPEAKKATKAKAEPKAKPAKKKAAK